MKDNILAALTNLLHKEASYPTDKKQVYALLKHTTDNFDTNIFTTTAVALDWPRRKVYALLYEVLQEVKSNDSLPVFMINAMSHYLEALEGNAAPEAIIRLNKDPEDLYVLCGFVRGKRWIYVEDYSIDIHYSGIICHMEREISEKIQQYIFIPQEDLSIVSYELYDGAIFLTSGSFLVYRKTFETLQLRSHYVIRTEEEELKQLGSIHAITEYGCVSNENYLGYIEQYKWTLDFPDKRALLI
ncbi:hypothetical protein [Taibaiella soli]|uniref:Uncharacterized protein n=1 Tax=Taibaiella soli TaxID=1649169 RepID=A0A2W2ADQ9_9BACT|nr:hypothetical protein [Taibaiella soli]PZF73401.1 hypothetical protein DN068_08395 [Taibaiella soli]